MTNNEETVLVALQICFEKELDTRSIYKHFASRDKIDDLVEALLRLKRMGLVTVPFEAWCYGDSYDSRPDDVVISAVRLTPYGKQFAVEIRKKRERLK
ncbi:MULTISPECIES: hypothetical protein [Bacilli]|uniref:Uncharacterized protein n=1 Tax=Brevibacillus porteri TaxID=2126350 RepID=A0ABX5FUM9_9BACL|nr:MULTISPECIES: hypothetical protein [Bacilli]MEC1387585.1 hypothetical protein [Aerococcus viridans]MED1801348.1 hypothetical protein [Brevibacillus porteri]MED2135055.1 hypothetical protein [Brevibacillus porteri]MED2747366.1 hypothetical protein [Brevibacillus porteri]MED2813446.1 hypothetical protein [Brevibacillus porteri]